MRRLPVLAPLVLLAASALLACGGGGGDDDDLDPDAGDPGAVPCTPDGQPVDVTGRFGVLAALHTHTQVVTIEQDNESRLLLLIDLTQSGTAVEITATLCDLVLPMVQLDGQAEPTSLELGAGLVASVGAVASSGTLDSATTCAALTGDPFTLLLGAALDPVDGPLPAPTDGVFSDFCGGVAPGDKCTATADVNCACDQEADDDPGATLVVNNGPLDIREAFVALRAPVTLDGTLLSSDELAGTVEALPEDTILGCRKGDGSACDAGTVNALVAFNPVVSQQPDNPSTFVAKRVDVTTSCEELIAQAAELFGR